MMRHPLAILVATLSFASITPALARSGGTASGGHAAMAASHAGVARGATGRSFGYRGAQGGRFAQYRGTPSYAATGVFTPGNPTQTPVSAPAIYHIEATGVRREGGAASGRGYPGIYPVGVSDGIQPNAYVVRVPRG